MVWRGVVRVSGRYIVAKGMGFIPPELAPVLLWVLEPGLLDPSRRLSGPLAEVWAEWLEDMRGLSDGTSWRPASPTAWITTQRAAELLGVSDRQVRNLLTRRRLQGRLVDGRWDVSLDDVLAEVDARSAA